MTGGEELGSALAGLALASRDRLAGHWAEYFGAALGALFLSDLERSYNWKRLQEDMRREVSPPVSLASVWNWHRHSFAICVRVHNRPNSEMLRLRSKACFRDSLISPDAALRHRRLSNSFAKDLRSSS